MMGIARQIQPVTGAGAMSYTFAPGKAFVLEEIRLHLDVASSTVENFVIQLVSGLGTLYNVKLYSVGMNTIQDLVYQPARPHEFGANESLTFTWANTNLRTWGMQIIYRGGD